MTGYRGILFDKDGTLFDFNATWVPWSARILTELAGGDLTLARRLGARVGYDLDAGRFEGWSPIVSDTPDVIAAALAPDLPDQSPMEVEARMVAAAQGVEVVEATPLAPFLSGLRQSGFALGVATNDGEAPARSNLDRVGVTGHFDFIAGYDSGFAGKPAPDMLLAFAEAVDLLPETVLMVGDSAHDLVAGRAAGMATVGVLTGVSSRDDLQGLADVVLPDIGHLPAWLGDRTPA
ncbi:HAD family hydrolase [Aliiroseovarius sp. YM-037]|uniref:HAD family hydrolase n=1 Tax=Aliiroseovarius sp. YM-037 TaxID=3341728 RepID=UPI003A806C20